jgi:hypothetical protein
VPVIQDLSLASGSVGLRAECLELDEPLRLVACAVSPRARSASAPGGGTLRLYRVAGIAAASGPSLDFTGPARLGLVDAAIPLPPGEGVAPGSAPARREALFGLARRIRSTSAAFSLVPLRGLAFELSLPGLSVVSRAER